MAMRSALTSLPARLSTPSAAAAAGGQRLLSDGKGRLLSQEERAKESIYIQKMERERQEKLKKKLEQEKANADKIKPADADKNGKFSYGYASSPSKRASMEDFYETKIDCVDGQIIGLFGVFDGHGGAEVAEYVKENLFSHLLRHPKFMSDTKVAIDDAYKSTDSEFLESDSSQNQCGSTASTAVLVGDRLFVANIGDSRAIICRGGNGAVQIMEFNSES